MIFDAHTHMPSEGWAGYQSCFATVDEAVGYLKQAGTTAALFNTWQGVFAATEEDLEHGNAAALELSQQYQGFLFPGACIHPAFPDMSRRWLARFRALGHFWVGELVNYQKPYDYADAAFLDLAADCAAHGHVLQLHAHEHVFDVARRFPSLQVVCSHIDVKLCRRLVELPNAWVDISGAAWGLQIGMIEEACKVMGPDRLLYGTDFTGYEPRSFQVRLQSAVPAPEDRDMILSGNLLRLLDRAGPGGRSGTKPGREARTAGQ
jgi:predicted TIM-barrel fold metal-dependent hydrolase